MKSLFKISHYRLLVQLFHEKFQHQDKFDHNCHCTIYSTNNTTSFQIHMKQNKNHATLNQQPQPLYTPLLTYYSKMNILFMTQNVDIAFKVGSSFK